MNKEFEFNRHIEQRFNRFLKAIKKLPENMMNYQKDMIMI